jgi:hypothetical protein
MKYCEICLKSLKERSIGSNFFNHRRIYFCSRNCHTTFVKGIVFEMNHIFLNNFVNNL